MEKSKLALQNDQLNEAIEQLNDLADDVTESIDIADQTSQNQQALAAHAHKPSKPNGQVLLGLRKLIIQAQT